MKTFVRLIRRYVLAAVGIVLLLLFSGVAAVSYTHLVWTRRAFRRCAV